MPIKRITLLSALFILSLISALFAESKMVVTNMAGAPMLVRDGKEMPVVMDMEGFTNDSYSTTSGCMLDLSMNEVAGVRVLENTDCVIHSAGTGMKVEIKKGNAIFNLKRLPRKSTFEVETPTVVAAVRGTQFWGRVNKENMADPITTFAVREGRVDIQIKNTDQRFRLRRGDALDIHKYKLMHPPVQRRATADEMEAMAQAQEILISQASE